MSCPHSNARGSTPETCSQCVGARRITRITIARGGALRVNGRKPKGQRTQAMPPGWQPPNAGKKKATYHADDSSSS